jgi:hypothetical protein
MQRISSRVYVLPLFRKLRLTTTATGNEFGVAAERAYLELDLPEVRGLLPHAEEITFVSLTEGVATTTNFRWGLFCWSGFDRQSEPSTNPFPIRSTVTAAGSLRHAPYSTLTNFMLESRLAVGYGYAANGAAVISAFVSGALLVKTYGT